MPLWGSVAPWGVMPGVGGKRHRWVRAFLGEVPVSQP